MIPDCHSAIDRLAAAVLRRSEILVVFREPDSRQTRLAVGKALSEPPPESHFCIQAFDRSSAPMYVELTDLSVEELSEKLAVSASDSLGELWKDSADLKLEDKDAYIRRLQGLIGDMHRQGMDKVVLSRRERVPLGGRISPGAVFAQLCKSYPKSFNYLLFRPGQSVWCGSSPELLLSKTDDRFRTVSLAATKKAGDPSGWTAKEILEQQLVTDFIVQTLNGHSQDTEMSGPSESRAGKVKHLRTEISFRSDQKLCSLAGSLHPTPAVAGIGRDASLQWLARKEGYPRGLYTGYLGPVTPCGEGALYVNLRCMEIFREEAVLYLGGGILKNSDPEAEWEETVNKASVLRSVLDQVHSERLVYDHQ